MVTVAAVEGYSGIMGIGYSRPEYLDLIAAWLRGHDRPYRRSIILLVAQDTAQMLAREGWTREAMRQYIRERARIPFGEWNRQYHGAKEARKGSPRKCSPSPIRMSGGQAVFRFHAHHRGGRHGRKEHAAALLGLGEDGQPRNPPARELGRGRALSPFLQQGLGARIPQRSTQRSGMARELHSASPF